MMLVKIISIILLILTTKWSRVGVLGDHSHICFRPPGDPNWPALSGLGTDNFPSSDYFWGMWQGKNEEIPFTIFEPDRVRRIKLGLTLYPLYASDLHLNGWFRVKLSYTEPAFPDYNIRDGIKMFVLWIENQLQEVIGEWVTDKEFDPMNFPKTKGCAKNDLTRYMGISCGGAYLTQPITSNVVLFMRNETSGPNKFPNKKFVGPAVPWGDKKEFNFYFRISSHSCFSINQLVIKGRFVADRHDTLMPVVLRATGLPSSVIGAPDLLPTDPKVSIDCSREAFPGHGLLHPNLPFYLKFVDHAPDYPLPDLQVNGRARGCQANLFEGRCPINDHNILNFTMGKPINLAEDQNQAFENILPECMDAWGVGDDKYSYPYTKLAIDKSGTFHPQPYQNHFYKDYLKKFRTEKCRADQDTCKIDRISRTFKDADSKNALLGEGPEVHDFHGIRFDDTRGLYITQQFVALWNLRKGHGCANVIATLFFIPLSIFVSRYYKETFMEQRVFYVRFWYQVHIHSTGWITVLMASGGIVAHASRELFGPSLTISSLLHRIFGYASYVALACVVLGGGVRSMDIGTRKCLVCCHWIWGMILYVLTVACLITAVHIPGSPMATYDASDFPEEKTWSHYTVIIIIIWKMVDIAMHIIMTCFQRVNDTNMEVEARITCPSLIPVVREDEILDTDGSKMRQFVLVFYAIAALVFTLAICGIIRFNPHEDKGFGPMYCTHHDNGTSLLPSIRTDCQVEE